MDLVLVLVLIGIVIEFSFSCASIAARKGHSPILWAILGVMFPIIALISIALLPARDRPRPGGPQPRRGRPAERTRRRPRPPR